MSVISIYHLSVKNFSRGKGHSTAAAASYRSGIRLYDERQSRHYDYSKLAGRVAHSEIFAPANAPEEFKDLQTLVNAIEASEKRKDARLLREVQLGLCREFDLEQNKAIVEAFINDQFVNRGMIAHLSIHTDPDYHNPHCHILLSTRNVDENGFGKKNRDWDKKALLQEWRLQWQNHTNRHLEKLARRGVISREKYEEIKLDHRSLKDQGIERQPQIHMGKDAWNAKKQGIDTERGKRFRAVEDHNRIMELQKDKSQQTTKGIEQAIEQKRENAHQIRKYYETDPNIKLGEDFKAAQPAYSQINQPSTAPTVDEKAEVSQDQVVPAVAASTPLKHTGANEQQTAPEFNNSAKNEPEPEDKREIDKEIMDEILGNLPSQATPSPEPKKEKEIDYGYER